MHGDDDQFEKRVPAVDVERRVGFGKTQFLRQFQRIGIGHLFVENLGEDKVRRSVEDSFYRGQQIVVVIFFEVPYDGNAAASRCVVE